MILVERFKQHNSLHMQALLANFEALQTLHLTAFYVKYFMGKRM